MTRKEVAQVVAEEEEKKTWRRKVMDVVRTDVVPIVGYYAVCTGFYCRVEKWTVVDSLYYISITVSTIGYGDLSPTTNFGRLASCGFILVGIVGVFAILTKYATMLQEHLTSGLKKVFKTCGARMFDPNSLHIEDYSPEMVNAMISYPKRYAETLAPTFLLLLVTFVIAKGRMGLTVIDSIYFTVVSCTTVGYGDLSPTDNLSRLLLSALVLLLVVVVANTISELLTIRMRRKIRLGQFALPDLEALLLNKLRDKPECQDPKIYESDYIVEALLQAELVDSQVLMEIRRLYHWTAMGGDGNSDSIGVDDVELFQRKRHAEVFFDGVDDDADKADLHAAWRLKVQEARKQGARAKLRRNSKSISDRKRLLLVDLAKDTPRDGNGDDHHSSSKNCESAPSNSGGDDNRKVSGDGAMKAPAAPSSILPPLRLPGRHKVAPESA